MNGEKPTDTKKSSVFLNTSWIYFNVSFFLIILSFSLTRTTIWMKLDSSRGSDRGTHSQNKNTIQMRKNDGEEDSVLVFLRCV